MKQNKKGFTRAPIHLRRMVRGFTLIELLVVIAIIGILAAITVVSVQGPRNKAQDTKTLANLRQVASVMEQYYGDNGTYNTTTAAVSTWTGVGSLSTLVATYGTPLPDDGYAVYIAAGATQTNYCLSKVSLVNPAVWIRCEEGAKCITTGTATCAVASP